MKNRWVSLCASASLIFATAALVPSAKADEWDMQTKVTFNNPVEIPGMVLGPGTYTLRLLDSPSNRDVVEVMNADMTHLYRFVMAIPTYRLEPTDHTVITFEERAAGAPQAIRNWYYPGDLRGEEFLYGKAHPMMTAGALPPAAPAPAPPAEEAAPAPAPPAEEAAPAPAPAPAPSAEATPAPQESTAPEVAQAAPPPAQNAPEQLPKTASDLPLLGLLGGVSLAMGLCLRRRDA